MQPQWHLQPRGAAATPATSELSGASESDLEEQRRRRVGRRRRPLPPLDFSPSTGLGGRQQQQQQHQHHHQQQHRDLPAVHEQAEEDRPSALHFVVLDRPVPRSTATLRPSSPHEAGPSGQQMMPSTPPPRAISRDFGGGNGTAHAAGLQSKVCSCLCIECHVDRALRLRTLIFLALLGVIVYSVASVTGISHMSVVMDPARQALSREMHRIYDDKILAPLIPDSPTDPNKLVLAQSVMPLDVESMRSWGEANLMPADRVLVPFGSDVFSAMSLYPRTSSFVVFGQNAPSGDVDAIASCDDACLERARQGSQAAFEDLRLEGFITTATLQAHAHGALGNLPLLLASVVAAGGRTVHVESLIVDVDLPRCLKLVVESNAATLQVVVYCGVDNVIKSRSAVRRFLRSHGPFSVLLRATGYALHHGVLTSDQVTLNHLRAMILILAKEICQDDSGLPYHLLKKHLAVVKVYGAAYRGFASPDLVGLAAHSGSVLKSLYQKDLAKTPPSAPLPFHFGHRTTVEPGQAENDPFVKRGNWKGSILIVARGQALPSSDVA